MSANALEQLAAIDDLKVIRSALRKKMLKEASRRAQRLRYPGEWTADRLHEAHELAEDILELTRGFNNFSDQASFIRRKIGPLVQMNYQIGGKK